MMVVTAPGAEDVIPVPRMVVVVLYRGYNAVDLSVMTEAFDMATGWPSVISETGGAVADLVATGWPSVFSETATAEVPTVGWPSGWTPTRVILEAAVAEEARVRARSPRRVLRTITIDYQIPRARDDLTDTVRENGLSTLVSLSSGSE